jgi:hypothetical protein
MAVRLPRIADLVTPEGLEQITGPIQAIEREALSTAGFSGARHDLLQLRLADGTERRFVFKRVLLGASWTAYRTGDRIGREGALLAEPALAGVWEIFRNPYMAFALEDGETGLLMTDLTASIAPDVSEPISLAAEEALLGALARLHAAYWQSPALATPWLADLPDRFHGLHPTAGPEELRRDASHPLFRLVDRGWDLALRQVPATIATRLVRPAEEIAEDFAALPQTLLHGDAKIGNFAFLPDGLAAFDWAVMGRGPATLDLGYYLAVNAARLARPREAVIARYRKLLEAALGRPLDGGLWDALLRAAVIGGAGMLLWSKALALSNGAPGAEAEWRWWVERLEEYLVPAQGG